MAFGDTIVEAVLGKVSVPEDTDNSPNVIAEGAAVNTTVGITAHSTFANGNAGLDYSLSADSSGGGFKIDHDTGVVTVADPSKIDFESAPGHVYTITVLATKNNNFSNEQTFTISVNDVAPSAPVDSNAAANTVLEGAATGTTVGITASSSDVNGGTVTYSLIGDTSGGGFTINATTGVVTVADGSKIDFESAAGHAYTVTVQSSDGTLTSSQAFTINVGDVTMTTPVDSNGAANSVAEGAAAGTTVGITASATDPSGPATTYSLIGDTSGGGFTINASTGVVTVANPAKIDFESTAPGHTYNITVQASNGAQTTSQVFTVGVTDVAPSAPTDSNGAANTVVEGAANGTVVGVTASSSDVNGGAVTYSLTGDTSGGGFTINATTGVITVADSTKINFETAPGHAYTVTAQASDGTLTNSQTFTIAVSDVAPSAPMDSNLATNTVAEGAANGSTVGVTAFSTDVNGPGVTYSLVGDTSHGGFTINSTTGVITVADGTKLDYETTPSHNYTVTAQASDGTLTNSQTFTIALTDVAPTAPTDINGAANTVAEGAANGSTVGITASSVDPNGPATTYTLSDSAGGRFAIDSSTGIVTVANGAAIDFETAPGHAYGITVLATNGALATSSAFSIGVTDVGPSTPTDTNGAADSVFEGAANGTLVGITASSTDPGGGPAPTYTLTDNAGGRFAIDLNTGIVTVANGAAIDFETAPGPGHSYGITVQSTAGALSSTHTFSIGVGDVNEAPAGTDKTVTMLEGDSYTFSVADFGFSDPSDSVNPNSLLAVKMTTVPGAGTGTFTNNGVTLNAGDSVSAANIAGGLLVFTPTAHSNGSPDATFTFQVQDNGGIANGGVDLDQSANTVTINVNAVNDAPINSVPLAAQNVNEEGSFVFSTGNGNAITISDVDVGSGNETVTLTVTGGTLALGSHAGLVSFSPDNAASITLTGTVANVNAAMNGLTYTGDLNFNGTDTLVVSTNDNGNTGAGGPKIDSDPITINVAAVNDAPTATNLTQSLTINEDAAATTLFTAAPVVSDVDSTNVTATLTLSAAAGVLDGAGTGVLNAGVQTYTITGTQAAVNTALAAVTYDSAQDFNGSASVGVTIDDGASGPQGTNPTGTISITVNAVNDAPTATNLDQSLTINEDAAATTLFTLAPVVSDVDSTNVTATLTLSAAAGVLNGAGAGVLNAGVQTYTITGTQAAVNTALAAVTYDSAQDFNGSASVGVTIDDGASGPQGTNPTGTVSITVNAVNDAPTATNLTQSLTINEDAAATTLFTAAPVVSDVDSTNVTATLTLSAAAGVLDGAGAGVLNAGTLTYTISGTKADVNTALAAVTYDSAQDFNGSASVGVTVDDGASGPQGTNPTGTVSITVNAVNDAPTATNLTQSLTINEDAAATTLFTAAPVVSDVDSTNVTATLTLSAAAGVLNGAGAGVLNAGTLTYTITGTQAAVNAALAAVTYDSAQDFNGSASVGVTIDDGASGPQGTNPTGTVSITVNPVNDAPTLTAHDRDPLYAAGVQLFDTTHVSVGPTDESAQTIKQLVLTVSNVDGTGTTDHLSIDGTDVFLTDGNTATGAGHGVGISVGLAGGTATVTITKAGDIPAADVESIVNGLTYTNDSVDPGETARNVTISLIQDNGGTSPGVDSSTPNITSTVVFDQAPVVTAGATLNYIENATSVIDAGLTVTDADTPNMTGATVTITAGFNSAQDVLAFTPVGTITGSYNATTGVLTLSGTDTQAHYQTALESVTYHNTSDDPTTTQRTVSYVVNDGFVDSAPGTATINVTAVNDEPTLTATGLSPTFTENGSPVSLFSGANASTVEAGQNLDQIVLTVTNVAGTGATESLLIDGTTVALTTHSETTSTNGLTASVSLVGGTATVTLSNAGGISAAAMQTLVNALAYGNSSDDPGAANRVVTITSLRDTGANGGPNNDDNIHSGLTVQSTVTVTPVNDEPTLTGVTSLNPGFTENGAAVTLFSGGTASAVEAGQSLNNLVVTVSNVAGSGTTESLFIDGTTVALNTHSATTATNGMTADVTLSGGTATVTISHAGGVSAATIQGIIDGLKYGNTSENPGAATRVVTITSLSDTGSNVAPNDNIAAFNFHSDVAVTPVNDAPVVTIGATTAFTELANGTPAANHAPVTIAPSLTVSDVDSANLTQATFVLNNLKPSDALSISGQAGASGDIGGIHFAITSTATTETVTLTGPDTVANYNAVLDAVQFNNTSENPDTTARSYTVTAVDDGGGTNTGSASTTETVTAVNDAPVNTVPVEQDTIFSRTATAITGLSVSDVDSGAGETTVLSVAHGTLNVATVGGGAAVTNNGTTAVTLTGTAEQIATTLAASNGVVYTSGAFTGTDVLTVTTNDNGATGTGAHPSVVSTENLGVIPKVWFIDNSASAVGADGSQGHPFNSIAAFNLVNDGGAGHPQTNDYVYLKTGTGTYSETDGIHLLNGQQLVGAGDGLTFPDPLHAGTLTIETAGTRPVIDVTGGAGNDAIHLAQDNTIHGFNVAMENAAATGIVDNGGTVGTLNISNMNVGVDPDGGGALLGNLGQAISITHGGTGGSMTFGTVSSGGGASGIALGGTLATNFSATGGTLSGHTTSEVAISGGSGTVNYGGTIGDGSGLSASVSGRTAGTVTLSGNINDGADTGGGITVSGNSGGTIDFTGGTKTLNTGTGNAVALSSNTGATVDFTGGGLNIDTTSGTGFSANTGTVTVTGLGNTINTTSGTALSLSSLTVGAGGVTFDSASTTSAATGISIDTVTGGAINVNGGSIAGATTRGVDINAAQTNISIVSSIASTGSGNSVEVTNSGKAGGSTIAFSGGITDAGGGINLDNNDQNGGATINFTGALNIDSTTHTGFNATNGGTVNASNAANSINTSTGTALNVANTTIGGSNLIFHDISANGAVNGIVLNNTGSGHLTVTGSNSVASAIRDNSGGTIQSTTGAGISLTNTTDAAFNNVNIQSSGDSGVNGTQVTNFNFTNGTINNAGNAGHESAIAFNTSPGTANNIAGTLTMTGNSITNAFYGGLDIESSDGTVSNATISGNTITNPGFSGVNIVGTGTATTAFNINNATIANNNITSSGGNGIQVNVGNSNASGPGAHAGFVTIDGLGRPTSDASHIISITGNSISLDGTGTQAIAVSNTGANSASRTQTNFEIKNNGTVATPLSGSLIGSDILIGNNGYSDMAGVVDNNVIDANHTAGTAGGGGNGIAGGNGVAGAGNAFTPRLELAVTNNTITDTNGSGILLVSRGATGTAFFKIASNNVAAPNDTGGFATNGIEVDAGNGPSADDAVFLNIFGNTSAGTNGALGIGLYKQGNVATTNDFGIFDAPGGPTLASSPTNAQVEAFLASLNSSTVEIFNGSNFIRDTTLAPALNAAAGGVQASSPTPGETHLTQAQLDSVVAAAIGQWAAAGATAAQLAALHATTFSVSNLSDNTIGEQTPGHITIDADAAGHGWFVDPTPNDNSEFTHAQNAAGTDLLTDPSNAAAGHLDLLTTVTHELGHVLGLDDVNSPTDDLMYIDLVDGERRLPDAADVVEAKASGANQAEAALPVSAQAAANTPIVVGTAGNDTIDAGHGGSILFGGAGADNFVFGPSIQLNAPTPAQVTHVADYHAAEGDTFDFSAITSAFHNSGVNDSLVVRAVEDASGKFATLQVDHIDPMGLPSAPNWVNVAQLDGAHSGDAVNVLIDSHSSVHLAQIHVDLLV